MKCRDLRLLLEPYFDRELDLVRRVEIEEHLTECADCAEQERHLRSLRDAVSLPSLYYRAPSALRARIQFAAPTRSPRRRPSPQLAAAAAAVLLVIGASGTIGMLLARVTTSADDRLAERVVVSHVRSLQVEHLTDVVSSDQHTVKPWLVGKLDFAPQVPDLSQEGYALSGARLDYLSDRPVAALVYHRRSHAINVFTWPAANDEEKAARGLTRQGFNIRNWQRSGLNYWAISDLNGPEFDEFVHLFQEHSAQLHP
jgi:anti-sigma factor RsiW